MKLYTINKITYKKKTAPAYIAEDFQSNLLYFSKNYDKIKEKFREFTRGTDKFFRENTVDYQGEKRSAYPQNTLADNNFATAYFYISNDLCVVIYINEADITEPMQTPLECGDYVEIVPEAATNFAKITGFSVKDLPSILRVICIDGRTATVEVLCGSRDVNATQQGQGNRYNFPVDYFKRITKL